MALKQRQAPANPGSNGSSSNGGAHIETGIMTYPPLVHITWGTILLAGNIAGNMLQIQSTQAWFLGTQLDWHLDFGIWSQWGLFFHGGMDAPHTVAFIASWGAQFILMTSKIGTSFIQARALQKHGTTAHRVDRVVKEAVIRVGVWNFLAWAIILFDSLTDWGYSNGMGFWQQCFFVAVTFLLTFYCGSWGIMNIVSGIGRMKD